MRGRLFCSALTASVVLVAIPTTFPVQAFVPSHSSTITRKHGRSLSRSFHLAQSRNSSEGETEDERFNRLLRQRIKELDMQEDDSNDDTNITPTFTQFPQIGTLEVLALLVSVFFVATVTLSNGALFASAPSTTTPTTSRVYINPEQVLQQDFARDASSVTFGE